MIPSEYQLKKRTGVYVTLCGLAIYILKVSQGKRRIMEIQIFHHAKIYLQKNSSKRYQNPSRYHNSITNVKFQHKSKYHLSKILISK
jgi:hypothetical protein